MPSVLLVVECEVLDAGRHSVLLNALYIRYYHGRCQIGILAHILEITSIEGSTIDIDAGPEEHILASIERFFSDALPVEQCHIGIPSGSEACQRRKGYTTIIGPSRLIPFVPEHLRPNAVRTVGTP